MLLILATIINVLVAWGCARWLSLHYFSESGGGILRARDVAVYTLAHSKPGLVRMEGFTIVNPSDFFEGMSGYLLENGELDLPLLPTERQRLGWPQPFKSLSRASLPPEHSLIVRAAGWPCPAMESREVHDFSSELEEAAKTDYSGDHMSAMMLLMWSREWPSDLRPSANRLPLRPSWPGFGINTLLYALALAGVIALIRICSTAWMGLSWRGRLLVPVIVLLCGTISSAASAWLLAFQYPRAVDLYLDPPAKWGGEVFGWDDKAGYSGWNVMRQDTSWSVHCRAEWAEANRPPISYQGPAPLGPAEPLVPYWGSMLRPASGVTGRQHVVYVHAYGWPMCCLYWEQQGTIPNGSYSSLRLTTSKGIELDPKSVQSPWFGQRTADRALPLAPIWLGFAVDALLCAATWLLLWSVIFHLTLGKRRRRLRLGLCPKCKYPIGVSDVCTECGTRVRQAPIGVGDVATG